MKLNYYPETDSLYINLSEQSSVESQEISEGIVLDYDAEGRLVGIDIDNASHKVEMEKLILSNFPARLKWRVYKDISSYLVYACPIKHRVPYAGAGLSTP